MDATQTYETIKIEQDGDGITWLYLNRPEKRNAMNPRLNEEMAEVLVALDADDDCLVLVLSGAGEAFSAGMDLKEYFREVDAAPDARVHVLEPAGVGAARRVGARLEHGPPGAGAE